MTRDLSTHTQAQNNGSDVPQFIKAALHLHMADAAHFRIQARDQARLRSRDICHHSSRKPKLPCNKHRQIYKQITMW